MTLSERQRRQILQILRQELQQVDGDLRRRGCSDEELIELWRGRQEALRSQTAGADDVHNGDGEPVDDRGVAEQG